MTEKNKMENVCYDRLYLKTPLPFDFTSTSSKSMTLPVLLKVDSLVPSVISVTVVSTSNTIGHVAGVTSVLTVSAGNVAQGSRINAVQNLLSCSASSSINDDPLDWSSSPTQLSLSNSTLRYIDGSVAGNWVIFGSAVTLHTILSKKFGAKKIMYPGLLILPALFLSSPTAQSATMMIRFGNAIEAPLGAISLLMQLIGTGFTGWFLWQRFGAELRKESSANNVNKEIEKWYSLDSKPDFLPKYRLLFADYGKKRHGFISAELTMTIATGALSAFQDEENCGTILYLSTAVYGVYAASIVGLQPNLERIDRFYYGGVATAQFVSVILGAIAKNTDIAAIQKTAEIIPVALQYITLARSVVDLAMQSHSLYKFCKNRSNNQDINANNQPLLVLNGASGQPGGAIQGGVLVPVPTQPVAAVPNPLINAASMRGNQILFTGQEDMDDINKFYTSYFGSGIDAILPLRLEAEGIRENISILKSSILSVDTLEMLVKQIVLELQGHDTVLLPVNIDQKHWAGLVCKSEGPNSLTISYLDSENQELPENIKSDVIKLFNEEHYTIEITKAIQEQQKYGNCGPELIENFVYYLTGYRVSQEAAVPLHSLLYENSKLQEGEHGTQIATSFNPVNFLRETLNYGNLKLDSWFKYMSSILSSSKYTELQSLCDKYGVNLKVTDAKSARYAYKQISLKTHPDKIVGNVEAEDLIKDFRSAKMLSESNKELDVTVNYNQAMNVINKGYAFVKVVHTAVDVIKLINGDGDQVNLWNAGINVGCVALSLAGKSSFTAYLFAGSALINVGYKSYEGNYYEAGVSLLTSAIYISPLVLMPVAPAVAVTISTGLLMYNAYLAYDAVLECYSTYYGSKLNDTPQELSGLTNQLQGE